MIAILGIHGSAQHPEVISEFTNRLAPQQPRCSPRGTFVDGEGFTFFKRRSDRSIPHEELIALARKSISADGFVVACGLKDMLVVGYSSGAIFGTALLALAPENFVGAILLRPQPISDDFTFPELSGKPVLIISGLHDNRREPQHASQVADQLIAANAVVTHHALDAGHGWAPNDDDLVLARSWMDEYFPT
ncbi:MULTISPECIES: hypothetical protein [unclassified Sinorhizobium]|uniref:alpha/beta hydrolase n=1 Tax=unclassified Sinorhizobium TaxID=2613772 RepID=UPI0024C2437D|nr:MULTISPECIES: hypothetical protein [unclassified Sinorhizobium]MDK1373485.1 hypothetical protein [Sinorhizobium sp. 6-70]MDK1479720.1 hypothetical protein [Sinorhizobium sp. 6-117]